MDPLHLFPMEKWSQLEEAFNRGFPRSIIGFMALERQRYIIQCGLDYGFRVYCPFGDANNGMVAINIKQTFYELIIQCPNNDTNRLEDALKNTNVIDWTREITVPFMPKHVSNCINRIIKEKRLTILEMVTSTAFVLDKTSSLFHIELPPGLSFDLLTLEYVTLINSTWPQRYPSSDFYFELQIKAKMGYGLFKDDKLVSWVLIKEIGALSHLYTLEEERRKGYGEMNLKLISNVLLKEGKYVVAVCAAGNLNAAKLYEKLNFQNTQCVDRCKFTDRI